MPVHAVSVGGRCCTRLGSYGGGLVCDALSVLQVVSWYLVLLPIFSLFYITYLFDRTSFFGRISYLT